MHKLIPPRRFRLQAWIKVLVGLVISLFLVGAAPAMAERGQPANESQINKAIALRFAQEGWGTQPQWRTVWDDLVAADMVLHFNSFPEPIVGLEENKAFSQELFEGFPAISSTIEDIVAEGDTVIYRSTLEGNQTGAFLGMPATGKRVKMNDFTMVKIKNGKISQMWYETNLLSLMQQLGLAPDA
jgi:predicted ester cyclase